MKRRAFLQRAGLAATASVSSLVLPPLAWAAEKSKLKITGIRLVKTRDKKPGSKYTPAAGSWSTQNVEVANPVSIYPEYKPTRSLFAATAVDSFTVEVTTDKGITGLGQGGPGGGPIVTGHLRRN